MSRSSVIIGGAVAVAGLAIAAALVSRTPAPEPAAAQSSAATHSVEQEVSALRNEIGALKDMFASASGQVQIGDPEVSALKQEVAALTEQLGALGNEVRAGVLAGRAAEPQAPAQPQLSEEEQRAIAERQVTERMDYIGRHFEAEDVDPQWRSDVETRLNTVFQADGFQNSALVNAECRSTLCRLEVAHESGADIAEFESLLAEKTASVAPEGTSHQVVGPDGKLRSVIFLARSGAHLPLPNAPQ